MWKVTFKVYSIRYDCYLKHTVEIPNKEFAEDFFNRLKGVKEKELVCPSP